MAAVQQQQYYAEEQQLEQQGEDNDVSLYSFAIFVGGLVWCSLSGNDQRYAYLFFARFELLVGQGTNGVFWLLSNAVQLHWCL